MTPKEKAQDLWVKYYERLPDSIYSNYAAKMEAKYFALIAVDEIIESNPYKVSLEGKFLTEHITYDINYWEEVKKEMAKI
jgi:hypothetical protein